MAKILLIEDKKFISQIIGIVLKGQGYTFVTAVNGADGLKMLEDEAPDLVITDINLPDMSGFDILKKIKSSSTVPVIVLTAGGVTTEGTYLETALRHGAAAAFLKPVEAAPLIHAIKQSLCEGVT